MSLISASILLFMVMDPFGNIPFFLCVLEQVPIEKQRRVITRELLIALLVLVVFLLGGPYFLKLMHISESSLRIAGSIVLFLIAIKMVFGRIEEILQGTPEGEPLIVPLAIPAVAGPSAMAIVLLLMGQEPGRWLEWLLALFLAWVSTAVILLFSTKLAGIFGERGLNAIQRLMGLILTAISVEMFLQGIRTFVDQ
jgi:MarC family membrane protein